MSAVVLLPTPPLPDATAMMLRTPGSDTFSPVPAAALRVLAVMFTRTSSTPSRALTFAWASRSNSDLTGQAGVVSSMSNLTRPPSISRFLMKPRSTMLWRKSGSTIGRRASRTAASVTGADMIWLDSWRARGPGLRGGASRIDVEARIGRSGGGPL